MNVDTIVSRVGVAIDLFNSIMEYQEIEGFLNDVEGYVLMNFAELGPGVGEIVELGSFKGKSTAWLSSGAKRAFREKVTAIDHFHGSDEHQSGGFAEDADVRESGSTYPIFMQNLRSRDLDDYVNPVRASSEEAVRGWDKPIRLLFIDASHEYEEVKRDFELWTPHVIKGGIVALHDTVGWEGVERFYAEVLAQSDKYEQVLQIASLGVVEKLV